MIAHGLYSFIAQKIYKKIPIESPPLGTPNEGEVGKNCVFRPFEKSAAQTLTVENLCPSATVVRVHDGALMDKYAVSSTTLVVM